MQMSMVVGAAAGVAAPPFAVAASAMAGSSEPGPPLAQTGVLTVQAP